MNLAGAEDFGVITDDQFSIKLSPHLGSIYAESASHHSREPQAASTKLPNDRVESNQKPVAPLLLLVVTISLKC